MGGCISTPSTACCCPTPSAARCPPLSAGRCRRRSVRTRRRSAVQRCSRPPARRWPTWSTPTRGGVVLGADRAILLTSLADASSSRVGLGYEVVVTRLDDEANIAPWLRAANRYGAKVKWAEVDIETGELPTWQWESLITRPTRLVAITSASSTLGTVTDLRAVTKLVHDVGGAGRRRPLRGRALPADRHRRDRRGRGRGERARMGWAADRRAGLPRSRRSSTRSARCRWTRMPPGRRDWRSARISSACSPAWWPASNTWPPWTRSANGTRRERLAVSMQSATSYMSRLFDYLLISLRSLPP